MIAENEPAGARHVARHDAGRARDVPAVELRHQPHLGVDPAARRLAGEQCDRFAAVVILGDRGGPCEAATERNDRANGQVACNDPSIRAT